VRSVTYRSLCRINSSRFNNFKKTRAIDQYRAEWPRKCFGSPTLTVRARYHIGRNPCTLVIIVERVHGVRTANFRPFPLRFLFISSGSFGIRNTLLLADIIHVAPDGSERSSTYGLVLGRRGFVIKSTCRAAPHLGDSVMVVIRA